MEYPDAPQELHEIAKKMGLNHPIEALLCAPDRYEDCRVVHNNFNDLPAGHDETNAVYEIRLIGDENGNLIVNAYDYMKRPLDNPYSRQCRRLEMQIEDAHGNQATLNVFSAFRQWLNAPVGVPIALWGEVKQFRKLYFSGVPLDERKLGKVVPVYLGAQGKSVNSAEVHSMLDWVSMDRERLIQAYYFACEVIREDCGGMDDQEILRLCTPEDCLIKPENLIDLLVCLHDPQQGPEYGLAAKEIVARICTLGLQCRAQRENYRAPHPDAPIGNGQDLLALADDTIAGVERFIGMPLTENQKQVARDISSRLKDERPLNGLLNGEVGSGKTFAYAIPAAVAHQAGANVAIMAPTSLLADQIALELSTIFEGRVEVERVATGARKIRNPNAILVGTKGLATVAKRNDYVPNLFICDEQHKFDTASRENMLADFTHTLDVSATPIPRTLALSLYDGVDLYFLDEQPVKKDIKTFLIDVNDRCYATAAIRNAIKQDKRVAIVYTLVDGNEGTPAASLDAPEAKKRTKKDVEQEAQSRRKALESASVFEKHFPGKVSLLHGQMKNKEKVDALDSFRSGEKPLMVTTTIFETGIDVPDVSVIIIRDAQHLGVSQLHQLRGRLARKGGEGHCFLLVDDVSKLAPDTYERLSMFTRVNDGYRLAQEDMLLRGAGDLEGLQQKGKASTTFKGVKLTSHDLLMENRVELDVVVDDQADEDDEYSARHRTTQQTTLFA